MAPLQSNQTTALLVASLGAFITATACWCYRGRHAKSRAEFQIPAELLKSQYAAELKLAVELALKCGDNMVSHCEERGTVQAKHSDSLLGMEFKGSPEDFCTAIDLQNEELVTKAIQRHFADYEIIGEEATGTGALPQLTSKPTFIIDPIDGTTNFASGLCLACVSIGLAVHKRPVMGVVYAPMTRELYLSIRGHGAYRNGVLLDKTPTTTSLRHAVIDFEFGYGRSTEDIRNMVGAVERLLQHGCRATRVRTRRNECLFCVMLDSFTYTLIYSVSEVAYLIFCMSRLEDWT